MVKVSPIWLYTEVVLFVVIKEEICYTICKILGFDSFEVTSPEICGGFEINGVTEDGIQIKGMYYPPDFDYILFGKKSVARNGSFIPYSQFNPF